MNLMMNDNGMNDYENLPYIRGRLQPEMKFEGSVRSLLLFRYTCESHSIGLSADPSDGRSGSMANTWRRVELS